MDGTRVRSERWIRTAVIATGLLFQVSVIIVFYVNLDPDIQRLMPDDSFYYLKIARNISQGLGSVFSPGEPTNGYHPLWMGVLTAVQTLMHPGAEQLILYALVISVILNGLTALMLGNLLGRLGFGEGQRTLGMGLYLFLPWMVLLNLSGLETPLFFMCLVFFFRMVHESAGDGGDRPGRYALLGVAAGLLFLARTDSVFFIAAGVIAVLFRRKKVRTVRRLLMTTLVALLISLPWLLWCQLEFGSPVQSSGTALSYFRWHSMHPVSTPAYWIVNGGRLFHKLAIVFMSPFVYHARDFDTIIPVWCDVLMLLLVAAAIVWLVRRRRDSVFPSWIWLPPVLLLVFYTFVRIASAVWHMSAFVLLLLLVILNVAGPRIGRTRVFLLLAACLALNIYTLGNGYYYPQQADGLISSARSIGGETGEVLDIGSTDAGYMGYFSRHTIVNLDGVVNQRAFEHIREGTFCEYLEELDLDIVLISADRLEFYCRNGEMYQLP